MVAIAVPSFGLVLLNIQFQVTAAERRGWQGSWQQRSSGDEQTPLVCFLPLLAAAAGAGLPRHRICRRRTAPPNCVAATTFTFHRVHHFSVFTGIQMAMYTNVEFAGLPYLCSAFSHRSRLTLPPVADENSQFVQRKAFNSCPQFIVSFLCIHVAEKLSVLGHFRTLLGHFGTPVLLLHLSLVGASCKLITGSTHPTNKWIGLLKASVF